MKNYMKIVSIFLILLFCLSPLAAMDTNQSSETANITHDIKNELKDPKLNIKIKDVKAGQKAVAEITSDADLKGKWLPVEVKLKDSRYSYTGYVIDGKANITIDYVLPIGEHTATLYYPGNDEYKPVNKSTTFTVK